MKHIGTKNIETDRLLLRPFRIDDAQSMYENLDNDPNSGKVMLKCGMKYEGTKRQGDLNNQGICDSSDYAILAREYNSIFK